MVIVFVSVMWSGVFYMIYNYVYFIQYKFICQERHALTRVVTTTVTSSDYEKRPNITRPLPDIIYDPYNIHLTGILN